MLHTKLQKPLNTERKSFSQEKGIKKGIRNLISSKESLFAV